MLAGREALPHRQAVFPIEQKSPMLTRSARTGETRIRAPLTGDDRLVLSGFGLDCAVADLYARMPVARASGPD
jgi:hypothetical protein